MNTPHVLLFPRQWSLICCLFSKQPPSASHGHSDNSCRTSRVSARDLNRLVWRGPRHVKRAQDLQPHGFHGAGEKRRGPVTGHWQERSFLSWTHMVVNFSSATYHQWSWASDLSLQGSQIPLFNENNDKAYLPEWLYILNAQRQQPEGSNYFTLQTIALYREMQSYAITIIRVNALIYIVIKAPVFGSGLSITYHRPECHCGLPSSWWLTDGRHQLRSNQICFVLLASF